LSVFVVVIFIDVKEIKFIKFVKLLRNYDFLCDNVEFLFFFWVLNARISGVTGVEVLAGLHWYLKYWCGSHISWDKTGGVQLNSIPKLGSLPRLQDDGILVQRPVPWNYYQNAVTSSCELLH